jgi:hypothetical protein
MGAENGYSMPVAVSVLDLKEIDKEIAALRLVEDPDARLRGAVDCILDLQELERRITFRYLELRALCGIYHSPSQEVHEKIQG